jgi:predicted DNA-binding transcriptional regulator YafY
MSQFKQIERISWLLNFLKYKAYPSKKQIINHLAEKEIYLTERSFERDLKTIRELFFIDVEYNRFKNGYYINTESFSDFSEWVQVFELVNNYQVLNETLIQLTSNCQFIDFDRSTLKLNPEFLKLILKAIINKQYIQFEYTNYQTNAVKSVVLQSVLLKEFQNRWYVCGCEDNGVFKSYGIDRITNLVLINEFFSPTIKNPKELFDQIIGLTLEEYSLEQVILSFHPLQGKYIKSQPLHSSQQILIEDEIEIRIAIRVIPNYELEEQILKHGERVKVIEPQWLREEIKSRLQKAIHYY